MLIMKWFNCHYLLGNKPGNNVSRMDINSAYSHDLLPVAWAQFSQQHADQQVELRNLEEGRKKKIQSNAEENCQKSANLNSHETELTTICFEIILPVSLVLLVIERTTYTLYVWMKTMWKIQQTHHWSLINDWDTKDNQKKTCVLWQTIQSVHWREREIIHTTTKDMPTLNSADEIDTSDVVIQLWV